MSISYPRLPGAITAANQQHQGPVKSLLDIAIDACVHNKQYLGDVGFIEAPHLRRILPHCNRTQLEAIEDDTLGRDLSWFTWDCWYVIFTQLYGPPGPDDTLLQLPDPDPPSDYSPPRGLTAPPADYRSMVYTREASIAARKAAAVSKLRAGYGKEAAAREALQIKYTVKLPPPKRARRGAVMMEQQAAAAPGRTIAGKPASKVLKHLGLAGGGGGSSSRPAHTSQHHHQQQRRPVYSGYTSSSQQQQQQNQQRPAGSSSGRNIGSSAAAAAGGQSSRGQLGAGSSRQGVQAAAAARNIGAGAPQQQQRQGTLIDQKRQAAAGQLLDRPIALNASRGGVAAAGTPGINKAAAGSPGSKAAGSKTPPPGNGPSRTVGGASGVGLLDRPLTLRR